MFKKVCHSRNNSFACISDPLTLELNKIEIRLNKTPKISFSSFSLLALSNTLKKLPKRLKNSLDSLPYMGGDPILCLPATLSLFTRSAIHRSFDSIKIFLLCSTMIKSCILCTIYRGWKERGNAFFVKFHQSFLFLLPPFLKKVCNHRILKP